MNQAGERVKLHGRPALGWLIVVKIPSSMRHQAVRQRILSPKMQDRLKASVVRTSAGMWRDEDPDTVLSRKITEILRHRAMRFGLQMGPDGFVNLREMLSIDHGRFFASFTERDVVRVVRSNVKKRFSLSEDERAEYLVRANQGHTMGAVEDESLLVDVCQGELEHRGEVCVHGTYWNCWEAIKREGLRTMGRNHIHFAF